MVSMVIGNEIARAFSLVGALSIVRFRTVVEDTRDTAFVIFAVVVGMALGAFVPPYVQQYYEVPWMGAGLIGLVLGNLLGGSAVVETVFTIPGLGRLLVDAIFARDYPVIQGCMLFIAFTYVLVNLVIDLCYPVFDPRVTAE